MKRRLLTTVIAISMVAAMTACGSEATATADQSAPVVEEVVAEATAPEAEETVAEEHEHEWIEATCTEPKTCSICGETEGEPLGHDWDENTPNYQQAKTCLRCGETEGEPLKARFDGLEFAELDKEYDIQMQFNDDATKTTTAKVWFTNYKTFDSDDENGLEAVDGYEYKSVDAYMALGDDTQYDLFTFTRGQGWFDYYQDTDETTADDGTFTVSYLGDDYDGCWCDTTEVKADVNVPNKEYAEKYGWSGEGTTTYIYNYTALVPKGYDGIFCTYLDMNEYNSNDGDMLASKNIVNFKMD